MDNNLRESIYSDEEENSGSGSDKYSEDEEYNIKVNWKPAKFITYETMALTTTKLNMKMRPCGFKTNGKNRMIKSTCLLSRIKKLNMMK